MPCGVQEDAYDRRCKDLKKLLEYDDKVSDSDADESWPHSSWESGQRGMDGAQDHQVEKEQEGALKAVGGRWRQVSFLHVLPVHGPNVVNVVVMYFSI